MTVLITGAFGSLGSEFVRYFLERGESVTGLDNNEWAVASYPDHPRLTKKLRDVGSIKGEFDLIVHCAAYKHVDLIEANREAAYYNNVILTKLLYASVQGKVLFISTDKAVNPSSYYGETKRLGEELTKERGGIIARCGNFLGSSGSVIPRWEAAIERGEPLPITNPEMTRYMIELPDAVYKIMNLYELANPGEVVVPEMGTPVSLLDLADRTLALHGLTRSGGTPYPIVIQGMRPGEKMHEQLTWDDETTVFSNLSGIIVRR